MQQFVTFFLTNLLIQALIYNNDVHLIFWMMIQKNT